MAQALTDDNFWNQFEVAEYSNPQYDENYWKQFEEVSQNKIALEDSLKELPEDDPYVLTQQEQTEQLANMLFTSEELEDIKNKDKIGWIEYRQRGFVGWDDITPIYGTIKQAKEAGKTLSIAKKLEKGEEVSDADKAYMKDYLRNYVELQIRGMKWSSKGASMFVQAPAFMAEFALSGGLGEVAAKAAITGAVKGASKIAVKSATKAATKTASNIALKGAAKTASRIAGQQAVLVPMYATANYNERKIADGLNITDKGDMLFDSAEAESSNKKNALKALGTGEIMIASELSGGLIGKMASGVGGAIGKGIGKVKTTNVARGISAVSASIYNKLPKNVRVKLEASARLVEKAGQKVTEAGQKAKDKGGLTGFHGVAEEMSEERVEDILMTAFDLDAKEGYSKQQFIDAILPDTEQLLLEAGVFSIVGATSFSTQTVINDLVKKGYSEQEATTISQNLSEIEKENRANEILGEVKINEDIKEQEVIKEQAKIENKMLLKGGVSINEPAQTQTKALSLSDYRNTIVKNKFDKNYVETYKNSIQNKTYTKVPQNLTNEIVYAERKFNNVINEIYKNPEIINNAEGFQRLENQVDEITNRLPEEEELISPYYEKFYNAINDASNYLEAKNKKSKVAADVMYDMADIAGATESETELAKKEWKEKGTESKYFKKWFGDSKVVDENGKPLVVYHGSPEANIEIFDSNKTLYGDVSKGFNFFTNKKSAYQNSAKDYAEFAGTDGYRRNGKVYETYLSIKNPLHIQYTSNSMSVYNGEKRYSTPVEYYDNNYKQIQEQYKKGNYDGIIIENTDKNDDDSVIYLVPNSNQIKSVENQGTFDPENPNIYYDVEEETPKKTEAPITQEAETVEDELEVPETVVDKIIKGESKWGQFYTDWVDRYTPIENLVKKAEEKTGEKLDTSENPYFQARMYAGLVESIKQQVNDKTFIKEKDGSIKITGEGFLPIINDFVNEVKDVEPNYDNAIEDLSDYLIANRYLLDLKDRDGFEATEEQKTKALEDMTKLNIKYGDKIEDISKIADRIYAFNRRILHNLVDSGNMSQETYDNIIAQNPHHISYKRVMDDNNWGGSFVSKGKFTDAKSPVKRIKGSERDIQNIFVSTLEDVARILDVAERNKVARSIANLKDVVPEYIRTKKPAMEKRTAKVRVAYDSKMRQQLLAAIEFFGRTFESAKSIKTPTGYALGSYSEEEKLVRKKLGSQDRTLAHEVGHMLDFALNVENKVKKNPAIMNEIKTLAEDRFQSIVKLQDGEYVTEEGGSSQSYKDYAQTNKEMIANAFDLYFTSRDYVKRVAPETAKFIDNLFKGKYAFLNEIRPSSESAMEEIEQDVWTPSRNKPFGNVIEYFVEGKPKFIEVTKPLMDAVEGMNSQQIDFVNKFFTGSASMLRTGATITPEFAIRNFIRDQESAVIYIKNYNPFIDGIKGLFNVLGKKITGKNETYDEWVKAGGAFGSYMELNEKSVNKALKEFVGEGSKMRSIFSYANPIELAERFSSIFEQATRLGMYTRSKLNGATAMEAAFEAREGTLDFGRSGSKGRIYNKYLPFFNAGIQGVDKMVRAFRTHPYLSTMKALGSITLPQLALTGYYLFYAPDDDREEYLNIPQWQKDFFYCLKIGENWVRIPKDFTLGYVFGSVPERFITWAYQNKKPEGKDIAKMAMTLFGSVSPINNPTDVLPPILRTLIEDFANYDFFRNQHIYPEYMNSLEPSLRANKFNSETAKLLGEKLNMSPAKIDHTISSLLGTSGKYLTDAGDLIINSVREFNGEKVGEKVSTAADAPFIRGFVIRDPIGYQALSTNEFFENYKKVSEAHASYNKYKKTDREAAKRYKEKHATDLRAYKKMNDTKKQISDIGKRMDKIYSDKNLTNKEKQERLQPLAKKISDLSFETNVWYGNL